MPDYSSIGNSTTWKGGAVYSPVEGLRFRVTRSRDLRAPALYELLTQGGVQNINLVVRGFSVNIPTNVNIGNSDLRAEVGNTFTAGLVLEPSAAPGLHLSLDYYDIKITDAITTVAPTTIASFCNAGQTTFCNAFTFGPTGAPTALNFATVNAASLENEGIDFVASYRRPLSAISASLPGEISLNLNGTYVQHVYVNVGFGATTIDRAAENSNFNNYALPRSRLNLLASYSLGAFEASAEMNFISGGKLDNTWNTAPSNTVTTNDVPAVTYANLYLSHRMHNDRFRLFGSVTNLLNKAPPAIPNAAVFTITNGQYYDVSGRSFLIGASASF